MNSIKRSNMGHITVLTLGNNQRFQYKNKVVMLGPDNVVYFEYYVLKFGTAVDDLECGKIEFSERLKMFRTRQEAEDCIKEYMRA